MPVRDIGDLFHGGGIHVGQGEAVGVAWELRAAYEPPDHDAPDGYLAIVLELSDTGGQRIGRGGCSGLGLATPDQPVTVSMSGRSSGEPIHYVGQAVENTVSVDLVLSDGTSVPATTLSSSLPVSLWVAFTDRSAVLTRLQSFDAAGRASIENIEEHWPRRNANACWGPLAIDDDA